MNLLDDLFSRRDASDIPRGDFDAAKKELIRLRELLAMVDTGSVMKGVNTEVGNSTYATDSPASSPSRRLMSASEGELAPFQRKGALPRSPRGGESSSGGNVAGGKGSMGGAAPTDDPHSGLESRAGREFWNSKYGDDAQSPKTPSTLKAGTDPMSFDESVEGHLLWSHSSPSEKKKSRKSQVSLGGENVLCKYFNFIDFFRRKITSFV